MCLTLAGLIRLAAGQRSSLADERQQSVQKDGRRQASRLQQSVHWNLLNASHTETYELQIRIFSPRTVGDTLMSSLNRRNDSRPVSVFMWTPDSGLDVKVVNHFVVL